MEVESILSFNGSGVFNRLYTWVNDAAAAVKIRADRMDNEMNGFATGLTNCVTRDGQSPATANLPMGGFKHTGVAAASSSTEYATFGQLLSNGVIYCPTVGGTASAITLSSGHSISAYAAGMAVSFIVGSSVTGATTVDLDGLGAKALTKRGSTALANLDIQAGWLVVAIYDGTRFQVISQRLCKSGDIDSGQVLTSNIGDSNVTTVKIADSNVTTAKIADGNVTYAKVASASIAALSDVISGTASKLIDAAAISELLKSCSLVKAAAQSLPNNTITACAFDTENFDDGGWHDNATNNSRVTVDFTGRIRINGECYFNPAAACVTRLYIYKNGSQVGTNISEQVLTGSTNITMQIDHEVTCTSGDYFELRAFQNSGSAVNITAYLEATRTR